MELTSWLGDVVLGIVCGIYVRHREGTHCGHCDDGRPLHRGEGVRVRRHRALIARGHRLCLRCVERVAHADEECSLLDFDVFISGMEVRRDLITARHGQLDSKGGGLAGITAHDCHARALGKNCRGRAPLQSAAARGGGGGGGRGGRGGGGGVCRDEGGGGEK